MKLRNPTVAVVAVIALLALPGCADQFGISPSHPLGAWDVMDVALTKDKGLERQERKFQPAECFNSELYEKLEKLKVYQYREFAKTSLTRHVVLIAVDDANIVRAIGGAFHSGRKGFSDSGGKVEGYLGSLWAEVAGGPARFSKKNEPGADLNEFLLSTIQQGNVHGIWKKMPASGEVSHHQTIHDMILLWID